ncbi:MAG: hypothetical protein QOF62_920 [Pyrinomonadaceae bacterium]|nr:hypothetical protein [Pyrinomonadaceae bacterium]
MSYQTRRLYPEGASLRLSPESGEFQTLVANLYGTAASDNERTEHFVNNFYRGAYGRDATSTEIQQ